MKALAITTALAFSLGLSACGTTARTGDYGYFVTASAHLDQQRLATEAVQQLIPLYPPAKTLFKLTQPTPDAFGQAFIGDLRAHGYALLEFATRNADNSANAVPLRYVVDQTNEGNMFRLTVWVGTQAITRAYVEQDGSTVPAGYWVRQE